MMTKKFSTREKVLMIIFALLLVVAIYYLVVWMPTSESISTAREAINAISDSVVLEEAKATQIHKMRMALRDISTTTGTPTVTPFFDNSQRLLDELNTALVTATAYKLNFLSPVFEEDIVKRDLQLLFYAENYVAAREILDRLYSGPYRCDIVAYKMAPTEKGAADLLNTPITANLSITYYELNKTGAS